MYGLEETGSSMFHEKQPSANAVDRFLDRCEDTMRHGYADPSVSCWPRVQIIIGRTYKAPSDVTRRRSRTAKYHEVWKRPEKRNYVYIWLSCLGLQYYHEFLHVELPILRLKVVDNKY
jgi:hypothetical protein